VPFEVDPPFTRRERLGLLCMALAVILGFVFFGLMAQHEAEASARIWRARFPSRVVGK
jgi:hypothetical protein